MIIHKNGKYSATCDRCEIQFKTNGHTHWHLLEDFGAAIDDTDWHVVGENTYCGDCWDYETDTPKTNKINKP